MGKSVPVCEINNPGINPLLSGHETCSAELLLNAHRADDSFDWLKNAFGIGFNVYNIV